MSIALLINKCLTLNNLYCQQVKTIVNTLAAAAEAEAEAEAGAQEGPRAETPRAQRTLLLPQEQHDIDERPHCKYTYNTIKKTEERVKKKQFACSFFLLQFFDIFFEQISKIIT